MSCAACTSRVTQVLCSVHTEISTILLLNYFCFLSMLAILSVSSCLPRTPDFRPIECFRIKTYSENKQTKWIPGHTTSAYELWCEGIDVQLNTAECSLEFCVASKFSSFTADYRPCSFEVKLLRFFFYIFCVGMLAVGHGGQCGGYSHMFSHMFRSHFAEADTAEDVFLFAR